MAKKKSLSLSPKSNKAKNTMKISCSPSAKNQEQKEVLRSFYENQVTIVHGLAGTGKTMLGTLWGLNEFMHNKYEKMIFTRPAVEAYGERLGYLPGNMEDKIAPYMIPIMSFLCKVMTEDQIGKLLNDNNIATIPLAFLRGVTFENSFVLFDEAQNCRTEQMRLFLTRIGEGSKVVITGDIRQSDHKGKNGLFDAITRLNNIEGVGICELTEESIFRSDIVRKIEERYNRSDDN